LLKISRLVNGKIILSPLKSKIRIPEGDRLGQAEFIAKYPDYRATIASSVSHYVLQETKHSKSPSSPSFSFLAGNNAFLEFAKTLELPAVVFTERNIRAL